MARVAYLRYFRRVRLAPGVTLNLGKRGASLSVGVRGAHVTVGRSGIRRTVGLPGTGVFYTSHDGWHSGAHTAPAFQDRHPVKPHHYLLGCFLLLVVVPVLLTLIAGILQASH